MVPRWRRAGTAELQSRQAEWERKSLELDALRQQIEAEKAAFDSQREMWSRRPVADPVRTEDREAETSPEAAETTTPSSSTTIQSIDILRRLGFEIPEDDAGDGAPAPAGRRERESPTSRRMPAANPAASDEEDHDASMARYMEQLLRRNETAAEAVDCASPSEPTTRGESHPPTDRQAYPSAPQSSADPGTAEIAPRAVAPEID